MKKPHRLMRVMIAVVGWVLVGAGAVFNEWTVTAFFSQDGIVTFLNRILIWSFDIMAVLAGVLLLLFRGRISRIQPINLFLAAASAGFALLFCLGLDMLSGYLYLSRIEEAVEISGTFVADEHLGWKPIPGGVGRHRFGTVFDVTYTMDRDGFRQVANTGQADFRIFFFGDSFTFGHGVENEEAYPAVIAKRCLPPEVHVFNAGVSGFGIVQMYERFNTYRDMIKKGDLVVFAPVSSDLRRNMEDFVFVGQFLFRKKELGFFDRFPVYNEGRIEYAMPDTLYNRCKTLLMYGRFLGGFFQGIYKQRPGRNTTAEALAMIVEIRRAVAEKGARFALFFLPSEQECLKRSYQEDVRGFEFFDIMAHFPDSRSEMEKLIIPGDGHWNSEGHALAAEAICATLIREGLINE